VRKEYLVAKDIIVSIAKIGKRYSEQPKVGGLFVFEHYTNRKGELDYSKLDKIDGLWTRREILTRYLLLRAVLDQGPDIIGIELFTRKVLNHFYENEIRVLHKPICFFSELGIGIDTILSGHASVKKLRARKWAKENQIKNYDKYNLFTDNAHQVLGYAVYRWGVPLCVPLLLEKDNNKAGKNTTSPLVDYLESFDSAEEMSQQIKDNIRYGLGKSIGDKAAHLFAKWYIDIYKINKRKDLSWSDLSYELPIDSNVGRVLFRTGFLLKFADLKKYKKWDIIQYQMGKFNTNYIRATNIRYRKTDMFSKDKEVLDIYNDISVNYLKQSKRRITKVNIHQMPNAMLKDTGYSIGDLDNGLMYIGGNFCKNIQHPRCLGCPIKTKCHGFKKDKKLIKNYLT